jgi:hypothetical protein
VNVISRFRIPLRISTSISIGSVGFERVALLVSFIIPVLIRWIPETLFPYPIGFDTPLYISWGRQYASNPTIFPLILPFLGVLYASGMDMIVVMKYLPTLLYGFLGFSTYRFSRFYLGWSLKKSLLAVLLVALSFVSLRVSWDMHKQLMGTAFLLLALSYLKTLENSLGFIAFSVFSFLAAFSHELVFAVLITVLSCWILFVARKEPKKALLISAVMSGILFLFVSIWYGWHLNDIIRGVFGTPLSHSSSITSRWFWEVSTNVPLFLQLYGLLLFPVVLGLFKDRTLLPWLGISLLGSFSTVIFPFYGSGVPPYRWMFLVAYPFSFYMANGFDKLHFVNRRSLNFVSFILILFIVNMPTWGFLGLTQQQSCFCKSNILPETMTLSSIPLHDIEATVWLTKKFDEVEGTVLIVHGHYVGWASYFTGKEVLTFGELYGGDRTIMQAVELAQSQNAGDIYLLWYLDSDAYSSGFVKIAEKGTMKLYKHVGA